VGCPLFVAHQHVVKAILVFVERIVDGQNGPAGITEYYLNALQ
jgi:hypothetical protein